MADELGNKNLESETNEFKEVEDNYKIITIPSSMLPDDYKNLIRAPFLNSLRYGNDLFKLVDRDSYFLNYSRYIEFLLQRQSLVVRAAVLIDETVLGWSIVEDKTLHYVWVKKELRRQGIGRSLLPKEFDTITHITNVGINIWVNKFPEVKFDPYK